MELAASFQPLANSNSNALTTMMTSSVWASKLAAPLLHLGLEKDERPGF
jgi:hypothetical protein